jgi:hypothetical protein
VVFAIAMHDNLTLPHNVILIAIIEIIKILDKPLSESSRFPDATPPNVAQKSVS